MMGMSLAQFQPFSSYSLRYIAKLCEIESRTLSSARGGGGSHRSEGGGGKEEEAVDSQDLQCVVMELFLESRLFPFVVSEIDSFYEIYSL
jgi:hypothetical protein